MKRTYDDILNFPRHISAAHPSMPVRNRAAQFAPFSALAGYDEEIKESARFTDKKSELDEYEKEKIDIRLDMIRKNGYHSGKVDLKYFRHDEKKDGGSYIKIRGYVKFIDDVNKTIVMESGLKIPVNDVYGLDGDIFMDI